MDLQAIYIGKSIAFTKNLKWVNRRRKTSFALYHLIPRRVET